MARRPQSVTIAQVIIYIVSVLAALAVVSMIGLGVAGIVTGATMAGSAAGTDAAGFAGAFGGLIGLFAGAALVQGIVSAAFVALWLWAAAALGRASRAARIVVTVLCSIDVALGFVLLVASGSVRGIEPAFVAIVAVPGLLILLLWGPADSREYFAGRRPAGIPWQEGPRPPSAPSSPPAGVAFAPRMHPEPITTPLRLAPVCGRCGTVGTPGGAFCGGCGSPTSPVRHARA